MFPHFFGFLCILIDSSFLPMRTKCRAKPGNCVLDLCCGSGDLAFLLSHKVGPRGKVNSWLNMFSLFTNFLSETDLSCEKVVWAVKLQVIGLDFSKEQLLIASSHQNSLANACYKNIE